MPHLRIILAEDNPGDVLLVQTVLETEKLEVEISVKKNGQDMLNWIAAIDAGEEQCPDLILLDLNLPKYSGVLLLERLKASKAAEVPVIVVTSSDSPRDREVATRFETCYFRKPSDFDEFMQLGVIIKRMLALEALTDESPLT